MYYNKASKEFFTDSQFRAQFPSLTFPQNIESYGDFVRCKEFAPIKYNRKFQTVTLACDEQGNITQSLNSIPLTSQELAAIKDKLFAGVTTKIAKVADAEMRKAGYSDRHDAFKFAKTIPRVVAIEKWVDDCYKDLQAKKPVFVIDASTTADSIFATLPVVPN